MKHHTVNLKVPVEFNIRRTALNSTWREIIEAGLAVKENPNGLSPAVLEPYMTEALTNLGRVWALIKPPEGKQS